jgi:nucleoside-diphosphate-sugar epimerase
MYGDTNGQPIHEDLAYMAHTRKGRVRARMAEALLEAHQTGKARVTIGRGSDFYGPGVLGSSLGERTFGPALNGKPAEITGSPDLPHTYTYIDDFGEALAILGENESALGQVWHVPNPPTHTQRELVSLFFATIDKPVQIRTMGRLMLAFGGLFVPEAREMVEMMYEFEKPFIVDSSKFVQVFGDIATPHEQAMQSTASWYREWLELKSNGHKARGR